MPGSQMNIIQFQVSNFSQLNHLTIWSPTLYILINNIHISNLYVIS